MCYHLSFHPSTQLLFFLVLIVFYGLVIGNNTVTRNGVSFPYQLLCFHLLYCDPKVAQLLTYLLTLSHTLRPLFFLCSLAAQHLQLFVL
ncbi:hypothetical protein Leryth_023728 [Lithospermum erythrorhizon]|nr:hypothetical protein Leryth_023728 [Lithospermum erythrorhizon]